MSLIGFFVSFVSAVADLARVMVDGPTTGVKRQQIPMKWIDLTSQKCKIQRGASGHQDQTH